MITKEVFWCKSERHLFEWYPFELPSQDKMDNCNYCGNPLTYMGEVEWDEEKGIWIGNLHKVLQNPHFRCGSQYDATTGLYMYACIPARFELIHYDYLVDYHTGEPV